jgi:hypothetical protein
MVPLPRLPINTGESTSAGGIFFEKERNKPGGNFLESRGKQAAETKKKGETRGGKIFEKRT